MSRGVVPKMERVRDADGRRRQQEFTTLAADGSVHGPELPDGDWPEQTRTLYEALRRDPIAQTLTPLEFLHVIDTMRLHAEMWRDQPANAMKVAAEVRLRLQSLGVTPEARMKLRLLIDNNPDAAPVSKLDVLKSRQVEQDARRRRLLKAVSTEPTTKGTTP